MGLSQGVTMPALNSLMATWYPPEERAKFGPLIYGGMQFGTIVCLPVSGWLSASGFLGGWPSVFYVFGALGLLWGVPWFLLVHNRPESHPGISAAELEFIAGHRNTVKKSEIVAIPWRAIITSGPVWACVIMAWGGCFGFYALLTELPTYLANIQHFDMSNSGVLSALPYVCLWVIALLWGALMDRLYASGHLSVRRIRRLSTAFASYTPAVALVVMCFVNCNSTLAIVVLCVAVGCTGFLQREHPYGTGYRSQPGGDARRNHQHRRICHGVHCSGCGRRHHEGKSRVPERLEDGVRRSHSNLRGHDNSLSFPHVIRCPGVE